MLVQNISVKTVSSKKVPFVQSCKMFPSALLLFRLVFILQYLMPSNGNWRRIDINGTTEVEPEEITYQVLLQNAISGLYFCGGSLLFRHYVLTAAECVVHRQCEEIRVHAGRKSFNQTNNWYAREIAEVIIHDEYDPLNRWHNDIALLRLNSSFPPDIRVGFVLNYYDRIRLKIREQPLVPLRVKVAGYGIISENENLISEQMLKAETSVHFWEVCRALFANISYNISKTVICAFDNKNDNRTRISDVGSPLIYDFNKVIGITLSANRILNLEPYNVLYPLLFTNTSLYSSWIFARVLPSLGSLGR